jgi:hypothetical protein
MESGTVSKQIPGYSFKSQAESATNFPMEIGRDTVETQAPPKNLVCGLLLEKKKITADNKIHDIRHTT